MRATCFECVEGTVDIVNHVVSSASETNGQTAHAHVFLRPSALFVSLCAERVNDFGEAQSNKFERKIQFSEGLRTRSIGNKFVSGSPMVEWL